MTRSKEDIAKSFIGEHSAEYVLVPSLKNILLKRFGIVTPIFPYVMREGSNISRHIHKEDSFRVIGLYPRRPKLGITSDSIFTIKLNRQILLGAECGKKQGIPVIAGCPLAKDFWELGSNPDCLWIKLEYQHEDCNEYGDIEIKIDHLKNICHTKKIANYIFQNKEDLLDYLVKSSKSMNLEDAISSFKEIKNAYWERAYRGHFGLMSGYKPVYFLLKFVQ